jgi:hypothetical protein
MPGRLAPSIFESTHPFEHARIGAAAIYCSDGRYGEQFDDFLHSALKLPRYDRVAVPGGPGCLAGHFAAWRDEEVIVEQLDFLIRTHDLGRIVLIAHEDCVFYLKKLSVPSQGLVRQQRTDLDKAAARLWGIRRSLAIEAYIAEAHRPGRVRACFSGRDGAVAVNRCAGLSGSDAAPPRLVHGGPPRPDIGAVAQASRHTTEIDDNRSREELARRGQGRRVCDQVQSAIGRPGRDTRGSGPVREAGRDQPLGRRAES